MSKGKGKKNGFFMYMQERRGEVEANHSLTRGYAELADLISDEWKSLSAEDKAKYVQKAADYNQGIGKGGGGGGGGSVRGGPVMSQKPKPIAVLPEEAPRPRTADQIREADRELVYDLFDRGNLWISQPIVICNFSLYFEPDSQEIYVPAEIGLTAFSLQHGVFDNYGRIIDPGIIPAGYGTDAIKMVEKLGIPVPEVGSPFSELEPVMQSIESFLEMYRGTLGSNKELYVFALDCDYEIVTGCFKWLNENSKISEFPIQVRVLSLSLYGYLAATFNTEESEIRAGMTRIISLTSRYRIHGQPLSPCFVHPDHHKLTRYGLFISSTEVDEVMKETCNFGFYEELCCIYHYKKGVAVQMCALNISNRYAFTLLEILTISNDIEIFPGAHVPQTKYLRRESERRLVWLSKWGLTRFEMEMEDSHLASQED